MPTELAAAFKPGQRLQAVESPTSRMRCSRTEAGSASGPRRRFASTAWSVSAGRGGPHRSGSPYPQKNFGGPDASGLVAGTATTVDVTEETTGLVESGDLAAGADAHDASPTITAAPDTQERAFRRTPRSSNARPSIAPMLHQPSSENVLTSGARSM